MPVEQPLIELRGVKKIYGSGDAEVAALAGIDLTVHDGEFVAVMGPSGSGKSTCMNILGCLDAPTDGHYYFRGADVGDMTREQRALLRRHYIGFVFQGFNLLKRTTALENLELPLIYRGVPSAERRRLGLETLAQVRTATSMILIGCPAASCAQSGPRSLGTNRRLRWVGTFSRWASHMRDRSVAKAGSPSRSPRSWIGCLNRLCVAAEAASARQLR